MSQKLNICRSEGKVIFGLTSSWLNGSPNTQFSGIICDDEISNGTQVGLDLELVTGINSDGVGLLLSFAGRVRRLGGRLALLNVNPRVQRVLQITGAVPTVVRCIQVHDIDQMEIE